MVTRKHLNCLAILCFTSLVACSHSIHLVHVSDFDPRVKKGMGKVVEARSEQVNFMGFKFDTDYVEEARYALIARCSRGRLEGVTTQFSTSHGFFHWRNKILMRGVCIQGRS